MTLRISTDRADVDFDLVHAFLATSTYWARDIPRDTLVRAIGGSLNFSGHLDGRQVAYARVVTDGATFAYLADVFVLPECRGRGYSKALMQAVDAHPALAGLRRFMLCTSDAHGLYAQFGFTAPQKPQNVMERWNPDVYRR